MRAFAVVLCAALLLGAEPEPAPSPNPYAILARARDVFHAHVRPPYVVYNLDRREWIDDHARDDLSYTLRVWYRSRDGAALNRLWYQARHRAVGDLYFIRPAFNQPVDPGPPTADIFEPAPPSPPSTPPPPDKLRTIGTVQVSGDLDYRATLAGTDHGSYHLKLQALRDPERNRLRELWVDVTSFEVQRARAVDRLFLEDGGVSVPDRMDITFESRNGLPLIHRIEAIADVIPTLATLIRREEGDYLFDDISFPEVLPDWYFEPKTYGQHFRESPSR